MQTTNNKDASTQGVVVSQHESSNLLKMAEEIRNGKAPSNDLITKELDAAKEFLQTQELHAKSSKEESVSKSAREFLNAAQVLLEQKNKNDKIQDLVRDVQTVADKATPTTVGISQQSWEETRKFVELLRGTTTQIVTSPVFRQTILDTFALFRTVFYGTADKLQNTAEQLKDSVTSGDQNPTEAVKTAVNDAKEKLQDMKLEDIPPEQKQKIRHDIQTLIQHISSNKDLKQTYQQFLQLVSMLKSELYTKIQSIQQDKDVQKVEQDAKEVIESFMGHKFDKFLGLLQKEVKIIEKDDQFNTWIKEARKYTEKALDDPTLLSKDEFYEEGNKLVQQARVLAKRFSNNSNWNAILDEAKSILDDMKNDKHLNDLKDKAAKFFDNFTYQDSKGRTRLDTDVLGELKSNIIPFLLERIKEVPIPRIQVQGQGDFEYLVLDDMYLSLDDIVPDQIDIHSENNTRLNVRDLATTKSNTFVRFVIHGLKPKLKDFYFSFKRKDMMGLTDQGRANLKVMGNGMDIRVTFNMNLDANNRMVLGDQNAEVSVHRLDIDILSAEHKILLNMLTTLFAGRIEEQVKDAVVAKLKTMAGDWANFVNDRLLAQVNLDLPSPDKLLTKVEEQVTSLV